MVTGKAIKQSDLRWRDDEVKWLMEKYFAPHDSSCAKKDEVAAANIGASTSPVLPKLHKYSDDKVISNIRRSARAEEFHALFDEGSIDNFLSQSEAELALCSILAFFTEHDAEQIDELFRSSALYRDKWDEMHGDKTYGQMTIDYAMMKTEGNYDPNFYKKQPENPPDNSVSIVATNLIVDSIDTIDDSVNDANAGTAFALAYQDRLKYCSKQKCWYWYNDGIWQIDDDGCECKRCLENLLRGICSHIIDSQQYRHLLDPVRKCLESPKMKRIIDFAKCKAEINYSAFDSNKYLLNCENGTFDLNNMTFREHSATDLIRLKANVVYDINAQCPEFMRFLKEIFLNDSEIIEFVQKIFGYCLTGETSLDKLFIFLGKTTRNGKTTLLSTIKVMLGTYAASIRPESLIQTTGNSGSSHSEDIARLDGKRYALCSEFPENTKMSAGRVKELTGGGDITARALYQNSTEFTPQFKLLLDTNYPPVITDDTLFLSDRVVVIPMLRHFKEDERDIELAEKLQTPENLSGILNWCIEGYKKYMQDGLVLPPSIVNATEEVRMGGDNIYAFTKSALEPDVLGRESIASIYEKYISFCLENNTQAFSKTYFTDKLRKLYTDGSVKKAKINGMSTLCLCGFKYKSRQDTL